MGAVVAAVAEEVGVAEQEAVEDLVEAVVRARAEEDSVAAECRALRRQSVVRHRLAVAERGPAEESVLVVLVPAAVRLALVPVALEEPDRLADQVD